MKWQLGKVFHLHPFLFSDLQWDRFATHKTWPPLQHQHGGLCNGHPGLFVPWPACACRTYWQKNQSCGRTQEATGKAVIYYVLSKVPMFCLPVLAGRCHFTLYCCFLVEWLSYVIWKGCIPWFQQHVCLSLSVCWL